VSPLSSTLEKRLTPRYVGVGDAAIYLGISVATVRRRIADGTLPGYKVAGDLLRVRVSDLEALARPVHPSHGGDA